MNYLLLRNIRGKAAIIHSRSPGTKVSIFSQIHLQHFEARPLESEVLCIGNFRNCYIEVTLICFAKHLPNTPTI